MSDRGSWNALLSHPASSAGCKISGWNGGGEEFRMWDIRVECRRSRIPDVRHPGGMCDATRPCDGVSGRPVRMIAYPIRTTFHCFAMDSKELSSISDYFGDHKAIKTPKLNTIWLELIARVLNMPIGLKGDNYYSKVFKRVNYKLWNNTFWVVISTATRTQSHHWKGNMPQYGYLMYNKKSVKINQTSL